MHLKKSILFFYQNIKLTKARVDLKLLDSVSPYKVEQLHQIVGLVSLSVIAFRNLVAFENVQISFRLACRDTQFVGEIGGSQDWMGKQTLQNLVEL